ncbi:hypothetical protein OZ410_09165 [Robiginitalea sp. M366]|uniref:hypothetical protein n=1 Tax=Robiginitalea aestuariiviva TaxID=3036903 RepID=UPI00240CFAD9|nr:hypothetical protein [Robiginitalea aestuariiviva]MDG1572484.1 hypothetical protein [Robiginitalea aestuariiviva]
MTTPLNVQKTFILFGIPLLLLGLLVLLAQSAWFSANPDALSLGITIDLVLTIPLVYFLFIRKTRIPNATLIPLLILGMVVGYMILPTAQQGYLNLFKTWVFPVVELTLISLVLYKVSQAVKGYKSHQRQGADFYTTLKQTCTELLPKPTVIPVVTEIAVFYYGFIHWKKRTLRENEFSYHRESGTLSLMMAVIFIVAIETVVFHILLLKWSAVAAWILTFISIYSGLQLFGFLKSMMKRPIALEKDRLLLRYGIMSETTIDLKAIDRIELSSRDLEFDKETRKLSFLGALEPHNVILHLKAPHTLTGLYGVKRPYHTLALHVDEKARFAAALNQALQEQV